MSPQNLSKLKKKFRPMLKNIEQVWCGDGWFDLLLDTLQELKTVNPKLEVSEIKEKLGGLIIDIKSDTNTESSKATVWGILEKCYNVSQTVCEETGGVGRLWKNENGRIQTLSNSSAILLGFTIKL
jgi:hypothetical protein